MSPHTELAPPSEEAVVADAPPSPAHDVLDWAYKEFHRLANLGEEPDMEQWCARFPACQSALMGILQSERVVNDLLDRAEQTSSAKKAIAWPHKGERRGGFTILRELGRGAFARVYLAVEPSAGHRRVVVKFSRLGRGEARTLGPITHDNIAPVLSARRDKISGLMMICMPFLGTATLDHVLNRLGSAQTGAPPRQASIFLDIIRSGEQPKDVPSAVPSHRLQRGSYVEGVMHLVMQLAQTLAFLHDRGLAHRDLKPSNVLLDPSGKPLLLDFNLATSQREDLPIGGTLQYMTPEHLHALAVKAKTAHLDESVDVFALGIMAFELLSGEHPCGPLPAGVEGEPLLELLLAQLPHGFRPFRSICRELEKPVAAMLDRCLSPNPADRPAAAELAAVCTRQFSPVRRLRRRVVAHPILSLAVMAMLLVTLTAGAFTWAVTPPVHARAYQRGMQAYQQGDFDAAETLFDEASKADPNNERYRFARGCARLQQSKFDPNGIEKLDQVLFDLKRDDPDSAAPSVLALHAYIFSRKQSCERAINLYSQVLASDNPSVMALNNRAYCYIVQNDYKKAKDDLDRAALIDPTCQAVFYNRAHLARSQRFNDDKYRISQQDLQDIELAVQLGSTTSSLFYDAAFLFAQAAWDEAQQPICLDEPAIQLRMRQEKVDRALFYLEKAITLGRVIDLRNPKSIFYRTLSKHRAYPALQNLKAPPPFREPNLRLIDPVVLTEH